jgi:hypothetical protein
MGGFMRQLELLHMSRIDKKKEYYKKILEKVQERILSYTGSNKYFCLYNVPMYVMGWPLYSWQKACAYIVKKLRRDGFDAYRLVDNTLYISWEKVRERQVQETQETQKVQEDTGESQDLSFLEDLADKYK